MDSRYTTAVQAFIGCALLLLTQPAQAAGFYISEVGTPGSLGTAGVANPVNTISADSSWTNPAGMTSLQQDEMLTITGGVVNPTGVLERNFKDTWSAGVAFVDGSRKTRGYSVGVSYDSSPVSNKDRTIDLPFDETYKVSAAYAWKGISTSAAWHFRHRRPMILRLTGITRRCSRRGCATS